MSVPVVRRDDGKTIEYAEREIAGAIDANYAKGLDNHGQRTGVLAATMVRSARFYGRESGLELEERDYELAHCLSSASGGASKGFVTLEIARTVRATRGRSYDDKHSQTLVPVLQFAGAVTDEDGELRPPREYAQGDRIDDARGIAAAVSATGVGNAGGHSGACLVETRIRRLTPREVRRLMGREDGEFDRARAAGISDSQLYKQAGNALVPQIVTAIAKIIDNRNK